MVACTSGSDARSANAADSLKTAPASSAISVVDDAGNTVTLPHPASRIVSLIPSATETLLAIGAMPQLVGRTRYDVAPQVQHLPLVGGSVDPSIEAIVALRPELVISWESDKRQQFRERLTKLGIPIFMLRTQDTTDVFRGMANLGVLTGHRDDAAHATATLRAELDGVRQSVQGLPRPKVMYVVFHDPPMTVGPNAFIGQLINLAGGQSIFEDATSNWPNVSVEEIVRRDPDIVIVPVGEFKGQALNRLKVLQGWRNLRAIRGNHAVAVPADLLSRPSPNIGKAARVLRAAMHPQFVGDTL
ncbi:MAG: cobalamin-binding protein [Gemmatimonadaceae bacterium]|nr:cobalamin-binding protein [Gemmatimonadaceae bacterium]